MRDDKSHDNSKGDSCFTCLSFSVKNLKSCRVLLLLDCCGCSFNVGVVFPFQAPFLPITERYLRPSVVGRMRGCS